MVVFLRRFMVVCVREKEWDFGEVGVGFVC